MTTHSQTLTRSKQELEVERDECIALLVMSVLKITVWRSAHSNNTRLPTVDDVTANRVGSVKDLIINNNYFRYNASDISSQYVSWMPNIELILLRETAHRQNEYEK